MNLYNRSSLEQKVWDSGCYNKLISTAPSQCDNSLYISPTLQVNPLITTQMLNEIPLIPQQHIGNILKGIAWTLGFTGGIRMH